MSDRDDKYSRILAPEDPFDFGSSDGANERNNNSGDNNADVKVTPMSLEESLAACREQLTAESERRMRVLAEMENLRKRVAKEKEDHLKYATESLVEDLLPVLDNLDLAIGHAGDNPACKDLRLGVEMTRRAFLDVLKSRGIEECGEVGEMFDPQIHEAVGMEENSSYPDGRVINVVQKGFRLHTRLIRPAKVIINKIVH